MEEIIILNLVLFEDSKTNELKTRLNFIFSEPDNILGNKNYHGYSENACYYEGRAVFDKITPNLIGKVVTGKFNLVQNEQNKLTSKRILGAIEVDGDDISLL